MNVKIISENHEHEGRAVAKGSIITVSQADGDWLIEEGAAEKAAEDKPASKAKKAGDTTQTDDAESAQ